jgi:GNAT superfamily N-acetyltransferase
VHPDVTVTRAVTIRPIEPADLPMLEDLMVREFGAPLVVSAGVIHDVRQLPGFIADRDDVRAGIACYDITEAGCEVVAIAGIGVGSALLHAVIDEARAVGCERVWLITTNDNTRALRFYQRHGFDLCALRRFAVDEARRFKPEIPDLGEDDIPIRHELELELFLDQPGSTVE